MRAPRTVRGTAHHPHHGARFALGLGYRYDSYKLEATKSDFRGKCDCKFRGPQVFIHAGF